MTIRCPIEKNLPKGESQLVITDGAEFMLATAEPAKDVVQKLIESCQQTREGFRCAAEAVSSSELKRLFGIYAQQRTRFAEELRQHLPSADDASFGREAEWETLEASEALRRCFDADKRALDLYSQALASGGMPTKAHFLVSAQYSLLQRVHERVRGIFSNTAG